MTTITSPLAPTLSSTSKGLDVTLAQDLQFIEIADHLDYNWVAWMVEFTYNGIEYTGDLQACPFHPRLMHDTYISAIEKK